MMEAIETIKKEEGKHVFELHIFNIEFAQQTKKPVKWISKRQLFYCLFCDKMSILDL